MSAILRSVISPHNTTFFKRTFETVYSTGEKDPKVDTICNNLFDHKRDWYFLE